MRSLFTSLLRLTRSGNLLIIAITQYTAVEFLVNPALVYDWRLLVLCASTLMIAGGGYIINDYYDIKIDLINRPERVVIGKSITRRYALLYHTLLSFTGTALGFLVGWKLGVANFASAFLLWLYSNSLKRLPFVGNLAVALLTGASLVVLLLLDGYHDKVILYALFAFSMTLIREIIKDMEDLKGDHTFGCKTLPIVWGLLRTKLLLYFLIVLFAGGILAINRFVMPLPLTYFEVFLFLPLALLALYLIRADTKRDFQLLSLACKIIMILGVASMAII